MQLEGVIKSNCMSSEMVSADELVYLWYQLTTAFLDPNYGDPNARPDIAVIPLALSERGIRAIAAAEVPGLLDDILDNSRPVYKRMVHTWGTHGKHVEIPMTYGPQGQVC